MKKILALTMALSIGFTGCTSLSSGADLKKDTQDKNVAKVEKMNSDTDNKSNQGIKKVVNFENENYKTYIGSKDIIRDTSKLGSIYKKNYSKYIAYKAPNGKDINIVAQDKITDEQLLYAYNMLSFYINSQGDEKATEIANSMTEKGALLNMPNGSDGNSPIAENAVLGQPLYQNEVANVGSAWYINNNFEHRDATFEEILHMVHDYGIGTKSNPASQPELQKKIYVATMNSLAKEKKDWGKKGLWGLNSKDWLVELSKEGSLEQEYLASVVDSYYGLWGAFNENSGGMWGIYTSKVRNDIEKNDPVGYELVASFLPTHINIMNRIDPSFEGEFKMYFDKSTPYTHKSQYLSKVRLTGNKNSSITANDIDNILIGNSGSNAIDGRGGIDIAQYSGGVSDYQIKVSDGVITIKDLKGRDGKDTLKNVEVLRFTDKDIMVENL